MKQPKILNTDIANKYQQLFVLDTTKDVSASASIGGDEKKREKKVKVILSENERGVDVERDANIAEEKSPQIQVEPIKKHTQELARSTRFISSLCSNSLQYIH